MKSENKKEILFLLALINLIGFAYGIYYYSNQLSEWNPLYWILIIDCPLQALLVGIIFMINPNIIEEEKGRITRNEIKAAKQNPGNFVEFLTNFTSIGSIKYGLWTMIIILLYSQYFLVGEGSLEYYILLIAHFGLFLEGVLLAGIYEIKTRDLLVISLFYLFNDYSDYVIGTHPLIPNETLDLVFFITVLLSLLSIGLAKYLDDRKKRILRIIIK